MGGSTTYKEIYKKSKTLFSFIYTELPV